MTGNDVKLHLKTAKGWIVDKLVNSDLQLELFDAETMTSVQTSGGDIFICHGVVLGG